MVKKWNKNQNHERKSLQPPENRAKNIRQNSLRKKERQIDSEKEMLDQEKSKNFKKTTADRKL